MTQEQKGLLLGSLFLLTGCPPLPPPTPPNVAFSEFQPDIGRGGRAVAISVNAANSQVAIAAGESGGLFKTSDGGRTWSHVDSFPPFRMSDVAFAPSGFANGQIVVATALSDSNPDPLGNLGGVWASTDAGITWTHVIPSTSCFSIPASGYGIAFLAPSSVYVATDCCILANTNLGTTNWTQASNWNVLCGVPVVSVVAQSSAGQVIIDACVQGGGHGRSKDGGKTWGAIDVGPNCQSAHSLASSPLEANVLLATAPAPDGRLGGTVLESDDGGATWSIDLGASSNSERPKFVATRRSADRNPAHFDFYFSGRQTTCSTQASGQRCPTNTNDSWVFLPDTDNLDHDINGIAFDPSTDCAMFEVSDFGVLKQGLPSLGRPCGEVSAWTLISAAAGFGALQLYQIAGQVQFPITGGGVYVSGHTTLFLGTMDNMDWAIFDASPTGWQGFGVEGSFLQALSPTTAAKQVSDYELTLIDFGPHRFSANKIIPNLASGGWANLQQWTSATPPGNDTPPFLVAPSAYVQWSGNTLFLTLDAGATWTAAGTLSANLVPIQGGTQIASTPAGPAVYQVVSGGGVALGVGLLTHLLPAAAPRPFEIRTLSGTNGRGFASGLQAIWGNCFGQGSWYCQPIFAADPNDYRHLYAVDPVQNFVAFSTNAGDTWQEDFGLTDLVQAGGTSMADSIGNSQVHVIAFDPSNSSHVLAGTDQAGIFASANGGTTWSFLPDTAKATAITSFFFDNRTNVIYVGTYGRGLWKLTIDWATVLASVTMSGRAKEKGSLQSGPVEPAHEAHVTDGPTVQYVSATTALITWSTTVITRTMLRYGASAESLDQVTEEPWPGRTHRVHLRELKPGTTYYFRVAVPAFSERGATLMTAPSRFKTAADK